MVKFTTALVWVSLFTFFIHTSHAQTFNLGGEQKAVASDRATFDLFGYSVAISGEYAIVGSRYDSEENNTPYRAGSAYIFERDENGNWSEEQKLVASDRSDDDQFGIDVAISGNYAIVGAFDEDEDENDSNTFSNAGSAYIFERDASGNWNEVQKLVASDRNTEDSFGSSVSISGNYAVVGAFWEDEDENNLNTFSNAGSAYIFERDASGNWNEVQKLVASDRDSEDRFGSSVYLAEDILAIGANRGQSIDSGGSIIYNCGAAYIFERDSTGVWSEAQKINASDPATSDFFGTSISINDEYLIVGAFLEDHDEFGGNKEDDAGSAYIFERDGNGIWSEVQKLVASDRDEDDEFGYSVAISNGYAIVGSTGQDHDVNDTNRSTNSGSVYLFTRETSGVWSQTQKIVSNSRNSTDEFGLSVAFSDDHAIISSYSDFDENGDNFVSNAGAVYFFEPCEATSSTDVVSACESYEWIDGNTYTSANNTATYLLQNQAGCDSLVTLNLTINQPSPTIEDVIVACDSYTWIDNVTYESSNNEAEIMLTNRAGCDSLVTLNLTINQPSPVTTDQVVACESYEWIDGNTYTESNNTASVLLQNQAGCDSLVTLDLSILSDEVTDVIESCEAITWIDGNTYTESNNTSFVTLTNQAGCDSLIRLDLTILSDEVIDVVEACDSYTWIDGNTYTESNNTAFVTLTNQVGCDSLVTLNLMINPSSPVTTDQVVACENYEWIDGNTYTQSTNSAFVTFTNQVGCDSLVMLDLTINQPSPITTDEVVACESYEWIDGNTYTQSTNSAFVTLTNQVGCDSLVMLDLTINQPSLITTDEVVACESYEWIDGNTYTESNNSAFVTLTNQAGCDSLVMLNLTINQPSPVTVDKINECDSYSWIDGNTYTESNNTASFLLQNQAGCDSLIRLDLTILSDEVVDVVEACDSYTWIDGNTYTESNSTASVTLTNQSQCDSLVLLDLTITNSADVDVTTSLSGNTITANNANATYQWIDCGNNNQVITDAATQSYEATASGSYAVELTEDGCTVTSSCVEITILGLEELGEGIYLEVYPNPIEDQFHLRFTEQVKELTATITDIQGRLITRENHENVTEVQLTLEGSAGMYFLTIETEKGEQTVRIIKK